MHRFRNILVAVDAADPEGSSHSLKRGVKLAHDTGAVLHVVEVVPQLANAIRSWFHADGDAVELAIRRAQNRIATMCEDVASDAEYTCAVLHGRPSIELLREATGKGCDLIVKAADGTASRPLLGAVDMRLMRNSQIPVWIVKSKPSPLFERVLVAVDPFAETDEEYEVNVRLLDIGASLAEWERAELYVVAACEIRGTGLLVSGMSPVHFETHVAEVKARGKESLQQLLVTLEKPIAREHVIYQEGEPESVIVDFAREIDADVIVMGSLTRNAIAGFLIGNTASAVLRRVRRSVLTIKPLGFNSPVLPSVDSITNRENRGTDGERKS